MSDAFEVAVAVFNLLFWQPVAAEGTALSADFVDLISSFPPDAVAPFMVDGPWAASEKIPEVPIELTTAVMAALNPCVPPVSVVDVAVAVVVSLYRCIGVTLISAFATRPPPLLLVSGALSSGHRGRRSTISLWSGRQRRRRRWRETIRDPLCASFATTIWTSSKVGVWKLG